MKFSMFERWFPSATGLCDIRYRMWVPEEPRIALQITHGMAEHIDRYNDFATFLAENGVLAYGNDIVSHGKSIAAGMPKGYFGEKNGVNAIIQDMRTLRELVGKDYPYMPFILFGHSMGSIFARIYAGRSGEDFDAFIFSGTAGVDLRLPIGKLIAKREIRKTGGKLPSETLFKLGFAAYNNVFKPNRTANDWLSRDEAQVDAYNVDENCGFPFTSNAMYDFFTGVAEISNEKWAARVPKKPIYVYSGSMDPVGGMGKGVKQVYGWLKKTGHEAELKLYEGGRHEMLNEINRDEVYRDVLSFIKTVDSASKI